jgi:Putative quorum-sensing-regulated virulence factor
VGSRNPEWLGSLAFLLIYSMTKVEMAKMPFGKYKNTPIDKIDPSYLEWVLANCQPISPDLKRAICTRLGLGFKDDPKDKEIEALQQAIQELRQKHLVSRLEAYDQGYQDGKIENTVKKVKEWHQTLTRDYERSTEAMTVVNDAYDRLRETLEFKDE